MTKSLNDRINELQAELERVTAERDELSATVKRLRDLFEEGFESGEDHDLDAWEEKAKAVLEATPHQNLNAIKREAIIESIDAHKNKLMTFDFDAAIRVNDLIQYVNKRYPDKDGE